MERDPVTGRFLPGNKAAVGNRGNCNAKWGNRNAVKHGYYSPIKLARVFDDGCLYIFLSKDFAIKVETDKFYRDEKGRIRLNGFVEGLIEKWGLTLKEI